MGGPRLPASSPRSGGAFSTTTKSHPSASDFRTETAISKTKIDVGTCAFPVASLFGPYHRFDSPRQPLPGRASFCACIPGDRGDEGTRTPDPLLAKQVL